MGILLLDSEEFVATSEPRTARAPKRARIARGHRRVMGETRQTIELDLPKDPRSEEVFGWDFTDFVAPTDIILSIDKTFLQAGDPSLVLAGEPLLDTVSLLKVSQLLRGGRRGNTYEVTCGVRTTLGELLWLTLRFRCA
jgi:hypothetical protein